MLKALSMRFSWKTSLCGILGVFLTGASKTPGIPDWLGHIFGLMAAAAPSVGLLFARDNDKTSEDVGASKNGKILIIAPRNPDLPTTSS